MRVGCARGQHSVPEPSRLLAWQGQSTSGCLGAEPREPGGISWEGGYEPQGQARRIWELRCMGARHPRALPGEPAIGLSSAVPERAVTVGTAPGEEPWHGHGAPTPGLFCSHRSPHTWLRGAGLPILCSPFPLGSPRSRNNSGPPRDPPRGVQSTLLPQSGPALRLRALHQLGLENLREGRSPNPSGQPDP